MVQGVSWAIVATAALAVLLGARQSKPAQAPPAAPAARERPWLTPEAAAQIIGPGGSLGPLFAGVELGGPAPSPAVSSALGARHHAARIDRAR